MGVPGFLKKRFDRTGGGVNEYLIFRTQLASIALFVFSLFLFFHFSVFLLAVIFVLFFLNLYTVFKKLQVRNLRAYQYLFGGINVFGLVLAISHFFVRSFNPVFSGVFIFVLLAFLVFFYLFFKKNFVFGSVLLADGDWAVVKVPFDICSGVRNGFYAVRSKSGVKKGDEVKIETAGSFGERRLPWRIID